MSALFIDAYEIMFVHLPKVAMMCNIGNYHPAKWATNYAYKIRKFSLNLVKGKRKFYSQEGYKIYAMSNRKCSHLAIGLFLFAIGPTLIQSLDKSQFPSSKIITKDVLVIGGGASGAHAAVRLREDFRKSVVVVEKQDHLVSKLPENDFYTSVQ